MPRSGPHEYARGAIPRESRLRTKEHSGDLLVRTCGSLSGRGYPWAWWGGRGSDGVSAICQLPRLSGASPPGCHHLSRCLLPRLLVAGSLAFLYFPRVDITLLHPAFPQAPPQPLRSRFPLAFRIRPAGIMISLSGQRSGADSLARPTTQPIWPPP